jgi:hypothetical protein
MPARPHPANKSRTAMVLSGHLWQTAAVVLAALAVILCLWLMVAANTLAGHIDHSEALEE